MFRTEGIQIVVVVSLWVDRTVRQFIGVCYFNSGLIGFVRQLPGMLCRIETCYDLLDLANDGLVVIILISCCCFFLKILLRSLSGKSA